MRAAVPALVGGLAISLLSNAAHAQMLPQGSSEEATEGGQDANPHAGLGAAAQVRNSAGPSKMCFKP